jgi:hypothetical protein
MPMSSAEKMAAKRERDKVAQAETALAAGLEGEAREQALRDKLGYSKSETRSERERSDAAARMLGRNPHGYWKSRAMPTAGFDPTPAWLDDEFRPDFKKGASS